MRRKLRSGRRSTGWRRLWCGSRRPASLRRRSRRHLRSLLPAVPRRASSWRKGAGFSPRRLPCRRMPGRRSSCCRRRRAANVGWRGSWAAIYPAGSSCCGSMSRHRRSPSGRRGPNWRWANGRSRWGVPGTAPSPVSPSASCPLRIGRGAAPCRPMPRSRLPTTADHSSTSGAGPSASSPRCRLTPRA